jgi:aspartate aminotransferase-like enzyme
LKAHTSSSFSCDLKKWMQIAEGYEKGQHAYHTTMPTDALVRLRDVMQETREYGFAKVREQIELGAKVRALLESRGFPSVAAEGFKAPGVVVSYTTDPGIQNGKQVARRGPADGLGRAAAVRRGAGLQELPHRPVRAGKMAQRGAHGGPWA